MPERSDLCREPYDRPPVLFPECTPEELTVRCTFIKGHGVRHSWFAISAQDTVDVEKLTPRSDYGAAFPGDVAVILDNIAQGKADRYLEAILLVTHSRKRALRGTPGFPRKDS